MLSSLPTFRRQTRLGAFVIASVLLTTSSYASPAKEPETKRIVLLVDGVGAPAFAAAKARGKFVRFRSLSAHVAPFPAISDYSWNQVLGARAFFGRAGRIGSYEAAFFDEGEQLAHEDGRAYFHRLASPTFGFAAIDHFLNPFIEGLAYLPTTEIGALEIRQVERGLLASSNQPLTLALLSVPDALAHTRGLGPNGESALDTQLDAVDAMVERVASHFESRGIAVRFDLVADHGQSERWEAGALVPLAPVDLAALAVRAGLTKSDRLATPSDVVFPVMALASYATAWLHDPAKGRALVDAGRAEPWFDIGLVREAPALAGAKRVRVVGAEHEGVLDVARGSNGPRLRWHPLPSGDPLGLSKRQHDRWMSIAQARSTLVDTRPDALIRIALTALEDEAAMPDVLLSLRDGYRILGGLEGFTTMWRTHGSLSATSSLGILASTSETPLPARVLSGEVLEALGLAPADLYDATGLHSVAERTIAERFAKRKKGDATVVTGAGDFSTPALLARMAHVSDLSESVLTEDLAETFLALIPPGTGGDLASASPSQLQTLLSPTEMAGAIDTLLGADDPTLALDDPRIAALPSALISRIRKKFAPATTTPSTNDEKSAAVGAETDGGKSAGAKTVDAPPLESMGVAGRRALMRIHGVRALLEEAFTAPETSVVDDPRDIHFARWWHRTGKHRVHAAAAANRAHQDRNLTKLFGEILQERQLANAIAPAPLASLYPLTSDATATATVVYLSGVYDEVFDGKVFREGVRALRDIGVRVIEPPTDGACGAKTNAKTIRAFLDADAERQRLRGRQPRPYIFLAYSKGAVDALHLMKSAPQWAAANVRAFVTVAAPHGGAAILARRDLSAQEFGILTGRTPDSACTGDNSASAASTPAAMSAFYQEHSGTLVGQTRMFSVAFTSTLQDAHLWMKVTKNLGGFTEPNDGVVAESAAHFPEGLGAIHLATLRGDHLSGLLTSPHHFDQRALFLAVWIFLQESGGLDEGVAQTFRDAALAHSPWSTVEDRVHHLTGTLHRAGVSLQVRPSSPPATLATSASTIERALAGTPYEVGPFVLEPTSTGLSATALTTQKIFGVEFQTRGPTHDVGTPEKFARALLGALRADGDDLSMPPKERWRSFPLSTRPRFSLPENNLGFQNNARVNLANIGTLLDGKFVVPLDEVAYPEGISIVFDRRRVTEFRNEYEFFWEDTSPPRPDESESDGWAADVDAQGRLVARLRSAATSSRLTSFSMRFRPSDFPRLQLEVAVDDDVPGADVVRGGTGLDDSAFQLWFVLREVADTSDRRTFTGDEKVRIFGYYWGDDPAQAPGSIVENTYSERDLVIVTLPEARQLLLGHGVNASAATDNKPAVFEQNLVADLKRAFPGVDIGQLEIVALTFQHDSNDTGGDSAARFYSLELAPNEPAID